MSNERATLEQAVRLHQAGETARAEALYREVLQTRPQHADALHLLGVIALQNGQHPRAVELISQAIAVNSKVPVYHLNRANAMRAAGRLDDAIAGYQDAIRLKPDFAEGHFRLGNAF